MKKLFLLLFTLFLCQQIFPQRELPPPDMAKTRLYTDSRPWTRWWWFASVIDRRSVADNLAWLKDNGFGGVEIAWVYPLNRMKKDTVNYTPRQEWLSKEWSDIVAYAKHCADSLGLGCDFTFGSLWPFGDTKVPFDEATMNMTDPKWRQDLSATWDYPATGYVIDHLSRTAFDHYAKRTGNALKPALKGSTSGLFCDSWEVETRYLSTTGFEDRFKKDYGYSLDQYKDSLYSPNEPYRSVRYDYMKQLSGYVIDEFYRPFTRRSHELGAYSRAQCSGAPCDIISAYASVDVPESEALLYEPSYSNIVASAAALSGKKIVTSETFTCLYGWPRIRHSEEQTADLKLLADALFANGVNRIIWHGKPFNPAGFDTVKFYASVHVGKSGALAEEIPAFNRYMEKVASFMSKGVPFSEVAVYLPTEDAWIAGELPVEKQFIWAWGAYEMRYAYLPAELRPWRPMWINGDFLKKADVINGRMVAGDLSFSALYIDVQYMDPAALREVQRLASKGLPVCMKQMPAMPGMAGRNGADTTYGAMMNGFQNVRPSWLQVEGIAPLVSGNEVPDFWCRKDGGDLYIFFSNPKAQHLTFPLEYGQSLNENTTAIPVRINWNGRTVPFTLVFEPYQSVLLKVGPDGSITPVDIRFTPKKPEYIPRIKTGKDRWEVDRPQK